MTELDAAIKEYLEMNRRSCDRMHDQLEAMRQALDGAKAMLDRMERERERVLGKAVDCTTKG